VPDKRTRVWKRRVELERQLKAALEAQGRQFDIDAQLWVEQAATAKVNLEVIAAERSRGKDIPHADQAKQSTDLMRALLALNIKPTFFEAPMVRSTPSVAESMRMVGRL
jgi:hypothetical protein